jgi:hypothetical protein
LLFTAKDAYDAKEDLKLAIVVRRPVQFLCVLGGERF